MAVWFDQLHKGPPEPQMLGGVGPRWRAQMRRVFVRVLVRHAQGRRRTRRIAWLSRWFTDEELRAIEADAECIAEAGTLPPVYVHED